MAVDREYRNMMLALLIALIAAIIIGLVVVHFTIKAYGS